MEYRKYDVKLQATISVYDALGELPLDSLSYANVLKPLIDLDYVSQSKGSPGYLGLIDTGWMDVSAA